MSSDEGDLEKRAAEAREWKKIADAQEFEKVSTKPGDNGKGKADQKQLPVFPTYKYSKPILHEAAIVNGLPFFLKYDPESDTLLTVEKIEESSRVLRPPNREEYPYTPYEFANVEQLRRYIEVAKNETIDSLYQKAKYIVKKYNDQDDCKLNLIAIDILWSYFQDRFGTTHYIGVTGENDSGKSSIGNTFEAIGYRTYNMTSPSAANLFRVLGMIEAGQCTLVLDESERISDDPDIMATLRSGYDYTKKVPKINTNSWKQEWFFTYCIKIIIGEKSPSKIKAKGLLDRTLLFPVFPGDIELDIKEVTSPQERAPHLEEALAELLDFRKIMLVYRLFHFTDPIPDLDVGVKRRNKELCKPYIRLFYGSKAQKEVEQTFQIFLDSKNDKKSTSLEAILIPVIINLVKEKGNRVYSSEVWDFIKDNLEGMPNPNDPNEYYVSDYVLYRNTITKILEDKFGAEVKHTNTGNKTIFNIDKLQKVQKSYNIEVVIKTTLKGEGIECSEGSWERAQASNDSFEHKKLDNNDKKDVNISQDDISKGTEIPQARSQMPSQASEPSLSEEQKAAEARAKYDAARKNIRKMSR
jgi:hypothetical protein